MAFSSYPHAITQSIQEINTIYSDTIIKPPDRNKTHGSISKHLVVDSRDRDYQKYPSSSAYRIEIPQEWKDITSLELTLAQIPNTFYNISEGNNSFYISDVMGNISVFDIPEGQYTNKSLLDALNGKYGDIFQTFPCKLNFKQDPINLKLRIQSNRANNADFVYNINYIVTDNCRPCKVNNIDKSIGFLNNQYPSTMVDLSYIHVTAGNITSTGTLSDQDYPVYKLVADPVSMGITVDFTSTFYVDDYFILKDPTSGTQYYCQVYEIRNDKTILFEEINGLNPTVIGTGYIFQNMSVLMSPNIYNIQNKPYVILKIKEANILNSIGAANNAYTIIPLLNLENTIINQATIPSHGVIKYFNPPQPKMYWMDIEFLNFDGSPFNFRGQENMLMFTVTMLNQPGKYNNYVDSN